FDAQMRRTRQRPVVRHAMLPHHAFAFAAVSGFSGVALLCATVNPVVAALGLANIVLYAGVYTWTKRVSIVNTWVGAVVGAIPPMMGWAACTGGLEPGAWLLAGVLYAWQFPHFNALAWSLREDYFKAGYRMAVVSNIGLNARVAFRYAVVLLPLSFGAVALDLVTPWFALTSGVLNVAFIEAAWRFLKTSNKATAKTLFFRSLIFLPAWCILLMFHKKSHATYHDDEEDGDDHDPKLADPPRRSRFFVWRDRLGFLGKPCEHAL
ncbi:UbiA prenyltransferase, partial [Caulochytrium protostelioides]